MKKQISILGKRLKKEEQQQIKGGFIFMDCDHFCDFTRGKDADRYLEHQLERYGISWYHCRC